MTGRFDASWHKYFCQVNPDLAKEMPSVTTVLKEEGFLPRYKGTAARDRGTAVHEATELWDSLGVLPMDLDLLPFVKGWEKFRYSTKMEILETEQQVYHFELWYAGTLDRLVALEGGVLAILDIKTGSKAKWHGLQLAAYGLAHTRHEEINAGLCVYLNARGGFTTQPYTGDEYKEQVRIWTDIMQRRNA